MSTKQSEMVKKIGSEFQNQVANFSLYDSDKKILSSGLCITLRINLAIRFQRQVPFLGRSIADIDKQISEELAEEIAHHKHVGLGSEKLNEISEDLADLIKKNLLNKLVRIEISDAHDLFLDTDNIFCSTLSKLPEVRFLSLNVKDAFTNNNFLSLLESNTLENLNITAPIGKILNVAEFQKKMELCRVKHFVFNSCGITDEILKILSCSTSINSLDISNNLEISSNGLKALAQNSLMSSLSLSYTADVFEGLLALIKANCIQFLHIRTEEFKGLKLTEEQCEKLDQAFQQNTSLLRVEISNRDAIWPKTYPCNSFKYCDNTTEEAEIKFIMFVKSLVNKPLDFNYSEVYTFGLRNQSLPIQPVPEQTNNTKLAEIQGVVCNAEGIKLSSEQVSIVRQFDNFQQNQPPLPASQGPNSSSSLSYDKPKERNTLS